MTDTLELSRQLNACIKDSDVYKNYQYCKDKLRQKPEKLQQLMEFRKKNYEIQNNEMLDNPYDEVNNLFMEYDSIVHDTCLLYTSTERCRIIAEAAAKQSGRGIVPEITEPVTFAQAIEMAKTLDMNICLLHTSRCV